MSGTISNLGITYGGAQSSLNSDMIDKLKEADKSAMLKPTENALEDVFTQQSDYKELKTYLATLETKATYFSEELTYLERKTSSSGEGGTVTVSNGVDPQTGSIHVNQIAKQSVVESKGFPSSSSIVNTTDENQILKLKVDGEEISIDVTPKMTLEDLKYAINDASEGKVVASSLDTGGENPYKLIIRSKETGADQKIELIMEDSGTDNENADNVNGEKNGHSETNYFDLGLNTIQEASDASFTYNGVEITRESNTIEDLYIGVKIELKKDDSDISFSVTRDLDGMQEAMQEFVDAYNEAMTFIDKITGYDSETEESGSFQGDYRVNNIQSSLNDELFAYSEKTGESMLDFGLELTKEGDLTFDSSKFNSKMNADPAAMEKFFLGGSDVTASTYTSKVVGVEYVLNTTTVNGKQVNTFLEQALTEDLTIPKGSIKINDIELGEINLLASNTPSQNAQILMSAINAISDETFVQASVTSSGRQIYLTEESGDRFTIKSDEDWASRIGLEEGTYVGKVDETIGIFANVESFFDRLMDGSDSTLGLLDRNLTTSEDRLTNELQNTLDRINAKYSTMTAQFSAYNGIISGYQAAFSGVQMQIDQMTSGG